MGDPVFGEQDGLASSIEFGGVAHESSASVPKLGGDFMEWDSQEQVKIAGERIFGADVSMPDSLIEPVQNLFDFIGAKVSIDVDAEAVGGSIQRQAEVIIAKWFRLAHSSAHGIKRTKMLSVASRWRIKETLLTIKSDPTSLFVERFHQHLRCMQMAHGVSPSSVYCCAANIPDPSVGCQAMGDNFSGFFKG